MPDRMSDKMPNRMSDEMPDQLSQRMSWLKRMARKILENQPEYVSDRHQIKCNEMTETWKIDC